MLAACSPQPVLEQPPIQNENTPNLSPDNLADSAPAKPTLDAVTARSRYDQAFVYPYQDGLTATQSREMIYQRVAELGLGDPATNDGAIPDNINMNSAGTARYHELTAAHENGTLPPYQPPLYL